MPRSPGPRYWREVRPLLRGSIGDADDVSVRLSLVALGPAVTDQPLEMRERLGDGEPARAGSRSSPKSGYDTSYPVSGSGPSASAARRSRSSWCAISS